MTAGRPAEPVWVRGVAVLVGLACVGVFLARAGAPGPLQFVVWSDRDLARAFDVVRELPVAGAELGQGGGARVPGGAYYLLLAGLWGLTGDPVRLGQALVGLDGLAALALGFAATRRHGAVAGAVALALATAASPARTALTWLWNPSFVPPLAVVQALLLVRALEGRRSAWVGWGLAVGVGAQVHLTLLVAGAASTAAVVASRRTSRGLGFGWLAALATEAPFLALDLARGGANLAALGEQRLVHEVSSGEVGGSLREVGDALLRLVPGGPLALGGEVGAAWWVGAALSVVAAVGFGRAVVPGGTVQARAVGGMGAVVLLPALSGSVLVEDRYLLAAVPAAAWMGAVGAAALVERVRWMAVPLALLALALPSAEVVAWQNTTQGEHVGTWRGQVAQLERLEKATGEPLMALAGKTSWLVRGGDGWRSAPELPVDVVLALRGERFAGSVGPPCHAVLNEGVEPADAATAVAGPALLDPSSLIVLVVRPFDSGTLVSWDPGGDRCPTTMVSPYLDLPEDAPAAALRLLGEEREVVPIPGPPGEAGFAVRLWSPEREGVPPRTVDVAVRLRPVPGGVVATLSSRQLRGESHNDAGPLAASWLRSVGLVLEGEGVVRVPIAAGGVGVNGVATPMTVAAEVPAGRWRVRLEAEVGTVAEGRGLVGVPARQMVVGLGEIAVR